MDSSRRRSRLPLQQGEDSLEVQPQEPSKPEEKQLPAGSRFSPYPDGKGGMIIQDGFVR